MDAAAETTLRIENLADVALTTDADIGQWKRACLNEVHLTSSRAYSFIDRDDRTGELTEHRGQLEWPPFVEVPKIVLVHPLDCECPGAPHVVRLPPRLWRR